MIKLDMGELERLYPQAPRSEILKAYPTLSWNALSKRAQAMGIKRLIQGEGENVKPRRLSEELTEERHTLKLKNENQFLKAKVTALLKSANAMEATMNEAFKIKDAPLVSRIRPADSTPADAVAFMIASDWHIEESVDPATVNGLNFYNLEESKLRSERFFSNGAYLVKLAQKEAKIKKLVLPLLGDFITNSLRDENLENNLLLPGDALWRVKSYLVSGIEFLLNTTDVEIVLPCHTGNHGRMTEKVHIATEGGNSLEKYMYRNLAEYFENEPRVKFLIADGGISYIKIFDKTIRLMHGHSIHGGGGVGGITVPIRKAIMQLNKSKWADLTIMGHFHQTLVMKDFIVNGSLIGWNAFAEWIKADFEPPQQTFFILHAHNGGIKTLISPIWLDKRSEHRD